MASGREKHDAAATGLGEAVRFQRDLYLYWREARAAGGLALTTRGYLTRPALRRVRTALAAADGAPPAEAAPSESEDARLFFVRRLLERLALLRLQPGGARLVAEDRAAMAGFLALPLGERLRTGARVWVAGGWWPDRGDPRTAPPRLMSPAPPRIALARRRLLDSLAELATGASAVLLATPPASRPTAKGKRSGQPGQPRQAAAVMPELDIQRAALEGPLTWMGFALVSHPATGGRLTYRAGAAARALGATTAALEEPHGQVTLLPDFTIVAFPPLTGPELMVLDTCAEALAIDQTARYRLTRQTFAGAHVAGWSAQTAADRLEALAGRPLPSNVRVTLKDWERHGERLRMTRDVRLLEVRDAGVLDALLAETDAARWVERRLTAATALLTPEGIMPVRAWLLQRGELPALAHSSPEDLKMPATGQG